MKISNIQENENNLLYFTVEFIERVVKFYVAEDKQEHKFKVFLDDENGSNYYITKANLSNNVCFILDCVNVKTRKELQYSFNVSDQNVTENIFNNFKTLYGQVKIYNGFNEILKTNKLKMYEVKNN